MLKAMKFTKNNFPWAFAWNFILLLIACICTVAQLVNGSVPGFIGFGMITYVLVKLINIENR